MFNNFDFIIFLLLNCRYSNTFILYTCNCVNEIMSVLIEFLITKNNKLSQIKENISCVSMNSVH